MACRCTFVFGHAKYDLESVFRSLFMAYQKYLFDTIIRAALLHGCERSCKLLTTIFSQCFRNKQVLLVLVSHQTKLFEFDTGKFEPTKVVFAKADFVFLERIFRWQSGWWLPNLTSFGFFFFTNWLVIRV